MTGPASPLPALLRARLAELKLSQVEAARRAGLSRAGLLVLLSDSANPRLASLLAIRDRWPYPKLFRDLDTFS